MRAILDVVLPVFGLILAGVLAGRFKILGQESSEALNLFVYWFALPPLLFLGMARVPVAAVVNIPFLAAYLGGVAAAALLIVVAARLLFPGRAAELGLAVMGGTFSNTGYMGIPLFMTAYGPEGMLPVVISTVINSAVMVGGAIAWIELAAGKGAHPAEVLGDIGKALVTNPLVVAPLAGIAFSAAGIVIPGPIATFGDLLAAAAGPCALFAIGLFLAARPLGSLVRGRKAVEVAWLVAVKLVVHPLATWALAVALGLDQFWVAATVILAALPTGALAFVVASKYAVYVERTSAVILASTVVSVATLSAIMILFAGMRP
jgi:hypothetical protein